MKLRMTDKQLAFTANYLKTVPVAVFILLLMRWDSVSGLRSFFALFADCVWQGSVWPLYLIILAAGRG